MQVKANRLKTKLIAEYNSAYYKEALKLKDEENSY